MITKYRDKPVDSELYQKARDEVLSKLTIPEYFRDNIDYQIDLDHKPTCLCPFHEENTPSFRFKPEEGFWRCFGKCQTGGSVIDLHKFKHGFINHYEALWHLKEMHGKKYNLKFKNFFLTEDNKDLSIADIIKPKKVAMSMDDFLAPKEASLSGLITKIENQLTRLKASDRTKYIESAIQFDNLFVYKIKDIGVYKTLLDKLKLL